MFPGEITEISPKITLPPVRGSAIQEAALATSAAMSITVIIAFGLWPVLSVWMSIQYGPVKGLISTVIGGFLLLPWLSVQIANGLPPVSREGVIALSALAAVLACAPVAVARYRFHWLDGVVLGTFVVWGVTNLVNPIGVQQAMLDWWYFAMFAMIPYGLGRCVLRQPSALVSLAVGIVAGTLLMSPFVLYEMRMSPTLHAAIYGNPGNTVDMFRYGGWRPKVFQPAGLGMAIWLAASGVVAFGLLLSKSVGTVWRIPMRIVAIVCLLFGLLGRGGGAITLMVGGLGVIAVAFWLKKPRLAFLVPAAVVAYLVTAFTDAAVPIRPLMLSVGELFWGEGAGGSLRVRVENEAFLVAAGMQTPWLGSGGWGSFRLNETLAQEMGLRQVLTDGMWTIVFGQRGLLGLLGLYAMLLLPGLLAVNAAVRARMSVRSVMIVVGLSLFCWLYSADLLLNAFATPVLGLVAGALTSFSISVRSMSAGRDRARSQGVASARSGQRSGATAQGSAQPTVGTSGRGLVVTGSG